MSPGLPRCARNDGSGVSCDNQHIPNAREHQRAERVVNHGLVIHRHELLGDRLRYRLEPGAGASGQDDAFALSHVFSSLMFRLL